MSSSLLRRTAASVRLLPIRGGGGLPKPSDLPHGLTVDDVVPPTDFFAGGGARRIGGVGYGYQCAPGIWAYTHSQGHLIGHPNYFAGAVPDRHIKIDYRAYFSFKDYKLKFSFFQRLWLAITSTWKDWQPMLAAIFVFVPQWFVLIWIWRREPLEITMDREEFYRDFDSNFYGGTFDHHKYSEKLAKRRAVKWGYYDKINWDYYYPHH